jgi:hypothetical protein
MLRRWDVFPASKKVAVLSNDMVKTSLNAELNQQYRTIEKIPPDVG